MRPTDLHAIPRPGEGRSAPALSHAPVLLAEALSALAPKDGGRYVDGTFGGGGHTRAILDASTPDGIVLAIDADPAAVERARALATADGYGDRLLVQHGNFVDLPRFVREHGIAPVAGVLLDLGLSSFQLDDPERGFAFRFEGPLDMRFDPTAGRSAADLVNDLPPDELADIVWRYGEEPRSRRIAAAIAQERAATRIDSTAGLANIVERAVGGRRGADTHPATRTFQALRIAVNDELTVLDRALAGAVEVLSPGGRLVVIAFHSLEDRIVKRFLQRQSASCVCPPEQPVCTCDHVPQLRTFTRAVKAGAEEVRRNPRSRSAVLRAAERLGDGLAGGPAPRGR